MHQAARRFTFIAALLAATCAQAAQDPTLNVRINQSLKKGADYLLAQKKVESKAGGTVQAEHWDSHSSLLLYTLLEVGDAVDDPRLRPNSPELAPVVRWITSQTPDNTASTAFRTLALCQVQSSPEIKTALTHNRDALLKSIRLDGSIMPKPATTPPTASAATDKSWNTAETFWTYTALAALEDAGFDIDPKIWKTAETWLVATQTKEGEWPISSKGSHTDAASTAAGLSTLYLVRSRIGTAPPAPLPTAKEPPRNDALDLGLKKFLADFEPKSPDPALLERAASSAGLSTINGADWYRAAAEELLKSQRNSGAWAEHSAMPLFAGDNPEATASALLFLARGRAPVIFTKLDYSHDDDKKPLHWNDHPRDDANLTHWLSQQFDQHLNWQIASLNPPSAATAPSVAQAWQGTLDSPILLITGSSDPNFSADDLSRLRTFVQSGGMIFSVATGNDSAFTDAIVKKYAPQLADKRYEMRTLPPNHDLFDAALFSRIASPPPLLGLSNGIREWWIHSPTDLALSWQTRRLGLRDHFAIPANLVRYATGNGALGNKLETLGDGSFPAMPVARQIHLARLEYDGNFDPEPLAWRRLAMMAPSRFHTAVDITRIKPTDLDAAKYSVAHITGTAAFTLSDADIASLKKFLDAGGTLIADAGGANPQFTASLVDLTHKLYPDEKLAELPINDPLYNGSLPDSFRLTEVQYTKYALLKMKEHHVKPNIQSLNVAGRHVILFSPEDITSELLGMPTWGIRGYAPDSAFALARNMLLYASQEK